MLIDALFRPKSIAVIGASEKPTIGRRLIVSLDRIGFTGAIYPINPGYKTILGHPHVLDSFMAAAARGIRAAVIYDGGFAERGAEGQELQRKITDICREGGI